MERKTANINKFFGRFIWIGIGLSAFFWIIESLIHVFILHKGNLSSQILPSDPNEIWMRLLVVCLLIIFSVYVQLIINRRKRSEVALRSSEENLTITLNSIGDAVISTGTEGQVLRMNPMAEKLTGWNLSQAKGRHLNEVFKIINEKTRDTVESPVERIFREGVVIGLANHTVLISKDGTEFPIDDSGAPIRNDQGDITGVVLIFRDMTEKRQAEEVLKEYSEHLEELVEERTSELLEVQEELVRKEKLTVLGQLAGGMGHELRNPLGAIKNAAYFLNMALEEPEPEVKETLEILEKEVGISERIISSLLDFARPKPPTRRKVSVNDVVQDSLSRLPLPENVKVVSQLEEALPSLLADPDQLGQIFGNIIHNAIQAMSHGGQLTIESATPAPEWVSVSFTDTGVGISEEKLGEVFEPLFTTKAKGIGLGLALTKTLVEGHGGSIEVQSKAGKGSTFTVRLPMGGKGRK